MHQRFDANAPAWFELPGVGGPPEFNSTVISGLMRITGNTLPEPAPVPTVSFAAPRDYGDVRALTQLWNSLGFAELRKMFWRTHHSIDVEALLRVMVFNRLCDPERH